MSEIFGYILMFTLGGLIWYIIHLQMKIDELKFHIKYKGKHSWELFEENITDRSTNTSLPKKKSDS